MLRPPASGAARTLRRRLRGARHTSGMPGSGPGVPDPSSRPYVGGGSSDGFRRAGTESGPVAERPLRGLV